MTAPAPPTWTPSYSPWRHGGWYVDNIHYASGACGCVSRNYPDGKWRIVCDSRPNAHERFAYKTRDDAARAEYVLAMTSENALHDGVRRVLVHYLAAHRFPLDDAELREYGVVS